MKDINLYYRAFTEYRKLTISNKSCSQLRKYIKLANSDKDKLVSIKFQCFIEEDWVKEIEEGLVYVEKAVREERQFIRTEGEVVPIEKVKKVGKASVAHLARHSNLITHLPEEGNDIIPDSVYMVEKLSDYAVYENRFLYMLLRYLQDFIALRLEKIRDKVTTYNAQLYINKMIKLHNRNIEFQLSMSDQILHDEYLYNDFKKLPLIDRIEICYHTVTSLLQTPVMEEVSKSPMIREPITKTNVLKMNPNFKVAVALYEYIAGYKKDGFEFKEIVNEVSPFTDVIGDEYAELVNITSYLTYKYGNDFVDKLKIDYELEQRAIAETERLQFEEKIAKLKKRIEDEGIGYEEYIVTVDNRNNLLNSQLVELYSLRDKINEYIKTNKTLQEIIDDKNTKISLLNDKIDLIIESHCDELQMITNQYEFMIDSLNNKHNEEIKKLTYDYENQLFELDSEYKDKINQLISDYDNKISELIKNYDSRIEELNKHYTSVIESLNNKYDDLNNEYQEYVKDATRKIKEYQVKLDRAYEMIDILNEEKLVLNAKIHYLLGNNDNNANNIDYTSKDSIDQLELEYKAFKSFFNRNWDLAKKKIRKEVLVFPKTKKKEKVDNNEE